MTKLDTLFIIVGSALGCWFVVFILFLLVWGRFMNRMSQMQRDAMKDMTRDLSRSSWEAERREKRRGY